MIPSATSPIDCATDMTSFVELFERQVQTTPHAVAIEFEGTSTSYDELNRRANQLANFLLKRRLEPEERIGICLDRSTVAIVAMLGILKAGCAFVPLDPEFPVDRLAYIVEHASIRTILCDSNYRYLFPATGLPAAGLPLVGESTENNRLQTAPDSCGALELLDPEDPRLWSASSESPDVLLSSDSLAYVMYTSGSTGKPKGVQIEHRSLTTYCLADVQLYHLQADDRTLQFSTLNFDVAIEEIYPPLLVGSAVVVRPRVRANAAIELSHLIQSNAITALHIATAYWNEWVDLMSASQSTVPDCLRLVIVTGEKISVEHYRRWKNLCDHSILWCNAYGPTETTVTCTAFIPPEDWNDAQMPIGKPLPGYDAYILDDTLAPVGEHETGALFIGGPALARGYLGRPDLTEKAFVQIQLNGEVEPRRIYRTGDLARWLPSGDIEFAGRVDHQMKVGSYRIEPGEIESAIHQHPNVRESLVICDEVQGQKYLVAYVVQKDGLEAAELMAFLRERLPVYMVPSRYVFIDTMPKTINGKIDRTALPPTSVAVVARDSAKREPSSELECELAAIWSNVLNVPDVSVDDDFFLMGGSSLLVTRVIAQITARFDRAIPVRDFFANPTIASLALQLSGVSGDSTASASSLETIQVSRDLRSRLPAINPFDCYSLGCRIAGIHYPPFGTSKRRNHAVLLAPSYGHEYARAHRNLQQLAILLAKSGYDVIRFDYAGTGNSDGEERRLNVNQWTNDLRAVAEHACELPKVARVSGLGVRLGACLLCHATHHPSPVKFDRLICWDPVVDGRKYWNVIDAFHHRELHDLTRFLIRRESREFERLGYAWPKPLIEDVQSIEPSLFTRTLAQHKQIITSKQEPVPCGLDGWELLNVSDEVLWEEHQYMSSAFASPDLFQTVVNILEG